MVKKLFRFFSDDDYRLSIKENLGIEDVVAFFRKRIKNKYKAEAGEYGTLFITDRRNKRDVFVRDFYKSYDIPYKYLKDAWNDLCLMHPEVIK
jgi:hypothetical protein